MFYTKKVFLKISQNSLENTSAGGSLLKKGLWHMCSVNFFEILKEHLSYGTPLDNCVSINNLKNIKRFSVFIFSKFHST